MEICTCGHKKNDHFGKGLGDYRACPFCDCKVYALPPVIPPTVEENVVSDFILPKNPTLETILVKAFADISTTDKLGLGHGAYWNRRAAITKEALSNIEAYCKPTIPPPLMP